MECRCGCGQQVPKGNKAFVDRMHQYDWLAAGGAAEIGALEPLEARQEGGRIAGKIAKTSGRLAEMTDKAREQTARDYEEWQRRRSEAD
jgi:hypothetical protein